MAQQPNSTVFTAAVSLQQPQADVMQQQAVNIHKRIQQLQQHQSDPIQPAQQQTLANPQPTQGQQQHQPQSTSIQSSAGFTVFYYFLCFFKQQCAIQSFKRLFFNYITCILELFYYFQQILINIHE